MDALLVLAGREALGRVNGEPAAILLWEYPQLALQVVAVRRDHGAEGLADDSQALFEWWETAVRSQPV